VFVRFSGAGNARGEAQGLHSPVGMAVQDQTPRTVSRSMAWCRALGTSRLPGKSRSVTPRGERAERAPCPQGMGVDYASCRRSASPLVCGLGSGTGKTQEKAQEGKALEHMVAQRTRARTKIAPREREYSSLRAERSNPGRLAVAARPAGLLRRFAPRNDG